VRKIPLAIVYWVACLIALIPALFSQSVARPKSLDGWLERHFDRGRVTVRCCSCGNRESIVW
jgi:hypothetical protein